MLTARRRLASDSIHTRPGSADPHQTLAQTGDQLAIGFREVVMEAIDRLDDHPPLGEPGDDAQRVEPRFEFDGNADAQLWIVLHLFTILRTRWRTACSATRSAAVIGHDCHSAG